MMVPATRRLSGTNSSGPGVGVGRLRLPVALGSKMRFRFNHYINKINTIAMMFVGTAVVIPRYIVIERMGLIDNFMV